MKKLLPVAAAAFVLSSCGGDKSPAPAPAPDPVALNAPKFAGSLDFTIVENEYFDIRLGATDPQGDAVTFRKVDGKDSEFFNVGQDGAVSFWTTRINYDAPADADHDNIYMVDIAVSDGVYETIETLTLRPTNLREGYSYDVLASGIAPGSFVTEGRWDSTVLVISSSGTFTQYDTETGASEVIGQRRAIAGYEDFEVLDAFYRSNFDEMRLLLRAGRTVSVVQFDTIADFNSQNGGIELWSYDYPDGTDVATIDGSLNRYGLNDGFLGLSDGGDPDAAQDPEDFRGKIIQLADYMASYTEYQRGTASVQHYGLANPTFFMNYMIDRTPEAFSLFDFSPSVTDPSAFNFRWPYFEAYTELVAPPADPVGEVFAAPRSAVRYLPDRSPEALMITNISGAFSGLWAGYEDGTLMKLNFAARGVDDFRVGLEDLTEDAFGQEAHRFGILELVRIEHRAGGQAVLVVLTDGNDLLRVTHDPYQ